MAGYGLSGDSLPLANFKLRVLPTVAPGVYQNAITLTSASSLQPTSQLSDILANDPVHVDFSGELSDSIAVQISSAQVQGVLVASQSSPIFDIPPSQGKRSTAS